MQDSFIGALVVLAAGLTWLLQGRITTRQQFLTGLVAIGVGALATSLGILISDSPMMQSQLTVDLWLGFCGITTLFGILIAGPSASKLLLARRNRRRTSTTEKWPH